MRQLTLQVVNLSVKTPRYSEHTDDLLAKMAGVSPDELPRLREEAVNV